MIPGQNLLGMALSLIAKQSFGYSQYQGRVADAVGQWVSKYSEPVAVMGSVQPVQRSIYEELGLDLQKNYFFFYVSQSILDITRSVSGDQFVFCGKTFQALSKTAWAALDGWDAVLCVEVPGSLT